MAPRRAVNLCEEILGKLPPAISCPRYARHRSGAIVHLGVGASLRTGIAAYTDAVLGMGERDWTITAISLRSPIIARRLAGQDGLYTLLTRNRKDADLRVIGSIGRVMVAGEDPKSVIAAIASGKTRVVSLTVTPEGYCRDQTGSLDFSRAHSHSLYFFLAQAFLQRMRRGLPGVTVLSCDPMFDNGRRLGRLLCEYLAFHEPDVLRWFVRKCTCPNTAFRQSGQLADFTEADVAESPPHELFSKACPGVRDQACIARQAEDSWLIEDHFVQGRPGWEMAGAHLSSVALFQG